MTIVGKIMVVVVLVLSLVICTFAVFSYAGRYQYDVALKEANRQAKIAHDNAAQFYAGSCPRGSSRRTPITEGGRRRGGGGRACAKNSKATRPSIDTYARRVADAEGRAAQLETTAKAAQADVVRRQADAEKLRETLAVEINRNTDLVKNENIMRDRAVAAEIQVKSLTSRMASLENQLQDQQRVLALAEAERLVPAAANSFQWRPIRRRIMSKALSRTARLQRSAEADHRQRLGPGQGAHAATLPPGIDSLAVRSTSVECESLDVTAHEAVAQPVGRLERQAAGRRPRRRPRTLRRRALVRTTPRR